MSDSPTTPAGWYDDPEQPGQQRYWDGSEWTDRRQPAPPSSAAPAQPPTGSSSGNGMAVAAMVLGIIGALIALIPILGFFGLILGVLALILGFVARGRVKKGETTSGKGMATTGIVLGALAIVLSIVGLVIVNDAFNQLDEDLQDISDQFSEDVGDLGG